MKTYKHLYRKICLPENLILAFQKAKKGKSKSFSVRAFEKNLSEEIKKLQNELISFTYEPKSLRKFIIRDPKTRVIHASAFRDRVIHHALINIIGPIFEKRFILDSYASRIGKGTHAALQRFDYFKRKISRNGTLVKNARTANNVRGYVLKADIKHYFDEVDHEILISIIKRKIADEKTIWLIKQILENFENCEKGKGMPLGNYTSQFFANVYLNELDYFVKHFLKAKFYIRYVDDFIILHKRKKLLRYYRCRIIHYLLCLKLELHPNKTKLLALNNGIVLVGYKVFYHYKKIKRKNLRRFEISLGVKLELYNNGGITGGILIESLQGWFGYAKWANTFKYRKEIGDKIARHPFTTSSTLSQFLS